MKLEDVFLSYLKFNCPSRPPLLLGLSGGPDSMALFHLLVHYGYPFEAAHVNHGWREESGQEEADLRTLCQKHDIFFHIERLPKPLKRRNVEEAARNERIKFFKRIINERKLSGLLLAHHADDQAETVLKRLFEGASLPKLQGLLPKMEMGELTIFRPFLKVQKKMIIHWLNQKQITFFYDKTNQDPYFLRTRLREVIIPSLSRHFGKEVSGNLCRLGEEAAELQKFLEQEVMVCLSKMTHDDYLLDFNTFFPSSPLLCKAVIKYFFAQKGVVIPYAMLQLIYSHIEKESCDKYLHLKDYRIKVHQKQLSLQIKK